MADYTLMIAYAVLALGASFLCSILEAVLLSTSHGHIVALKDTHAKVSTTWSKWKEDPEGPLTAILTLNTIAHTVGALGVGSEVENNFEGEYVIAGSAAILTIAILLLSEILPKTIGALYWRRLTVTSYHVLRGLMWILWPIVVIIEVMRAPFPQVETETVTRTELSVLADIAEESDVIEEDEEAVIQNLLRLREMKVTEIMTPRVDVLFLSLPIEINDIKKIVDEKRISRMPVSKSESLDDTFGIVYVKDLFNLKSSSDSVEVENLVKDVIYLPEYTTVLSALNILRENKASFACVIDENGGIEGVITIKDVLSEFVGDLPDEHDQRFLGIRRLGPGQWRVDGKTDIDDFEEFFGLEPNEKDIATVGGLFLSHSEQLPAEGEKITIDGLEVTVTELDNRRIESFIVKKIAKK